MDVNTGTVTSDMVVCPTAYCSVGITDVSRSNDIRAFPNPAVHAVSIEMGRFKLEVASMNLLDPLGRVVRSTTSNFSERFTIPRDGLPNGHYELILQNAAGKPVAHGTVVFID